MPYGQYQYYDNNGGLWQISIPTDFATALNLTPALGNEPYLDPTIFPRYAAYRSTSPQNQRQAIVGSVSQFGSNLPEQLVVGGITFKLLSAVGESVPPFPFQVLQLAQGPQGQFAPAATGTLVGNNSGVTQVPFALTQTQATALINNFTSLLSGTVPASGGGTTNFLRADGSWTPAGLSAIANNTVLGNTSGSTTTPTAQNQTSLTALINNFSNTLSGGVPASGGGTTNFLRADGSWAAPSSSGLTYSSSQPLSNISLNSPSTNFTLTSLTLGSGTWLLLAVISWSGQSGGNSTVTFSINNGSNNVTSFADTAGTSFDVVSVSLVIVNPSTSTTYTLRGNTNAATCTVLGGATANTILFALQI